MMTIMKKRILFIIPSLKTGGTNSSLSNFYTYLKNKFEINVFALSAKQEANYVFDEALLPRYKFLTVFESSLKNSTGIRKVAPFICKSAIKICGSLGLDLREFVYKHYVRKIESQGKYDFVIGFQEGSATKFASLFNSAKRIAWVHCEYTKYLGNNKSELPTYQQFDKVICVSQCTSQVFKNKYPSYASNVDFIYNTLDIERVKLMAGEKVEDERFDNSTFTIVSAGRLVPIKQYHLIPQIAAKLKSKGAIFKWYLLGPKVTQEYYDRINNNIAKHNVESYVQLLGNKVNPYPYIKHCDVFACTSESEACPMVFCESYALGVPVVTTNFGSASEFIKEGDNGFSSPAENIDNNLYRLYSSKQLRDNICLKLKQYTPFNEQVYQKLNELLQ